MQSGAFWALKFDKCQDPILNHIVVVKHDFNQIELLNKRNPSNVHIDNIFREKKKKYIEEKSQVTKAKEGTAAPLATPLNPPLSTNIERMLGQMLRPFDTA